MNEIKNANEFKEKVLESDMPFLVDFSAVWCGPCRMVAPIVAELASDYEGRIGVAKVDIDECRDLAMRYSIQAVPTLMMFKGGLPAGQLLGLLPKEEIARLIDAVLAD